MREEILDNPWVKDAKRNIERAEAMEKSLEQFKKMDITIENESDPDFSCPKCEAVHKESVWKEVVQGKSYYCPTCGKKNYVIQRRRNAPDLVSNGVNFGDHDFYDLKAEKVQKYELSRIIQNFIPDDVRMEIKSNMYAEVAKGIQRDGYLENRYMIRFSESETKRQLPSFQYSHPDEWPTELTIRADIYRVI